MQNVSPPTKYKADGTQREKTFPLTFQRGQLTYNLPSLPLMESILSNLMNTQTTQNLSLGRILTTQSRLSSRNSKNNFGKADRSPPYPISPPFPRCRSADLFYNPARAPHLPQGVLRYVPQAHNLVSQTTQLHELTQAGINGSSPSTNPSANPNQDSGAPHPSPVPRRCFSSPPSNQDLSTVCRTSSLLLRIRYLEETFTTFPQTLLTLCRSKISLFCYARD